VLHTCATRFDVTNNLEKFLIFGWTKQGPTKYQDTAYIYFGFSFRTYLLWIMSTSTKLQFNATVSYHASALAASYIASTFFPLLFLLPPIFTAPRRPRTLPPLSSRGLAGLGLLVLLIGGLLRSGVGTPALASVNSSPSLAIVLFLRLARLPSPLFLSRRCNRCRLPRDVFRVY